MEKQKPNQLTPLSYYGQREFIIRDLFALLGNNRFQCCYDPFSGSGSLSFEAMDRELAQNYFVSDSFPVLRSLWELIKIKPQELISQYTSCVEIYISMTKEERCNYFSKMLTIFNECNKSGFLAKAAMLFTFLINYSEKNIPEFDKNFSLIVKPNLFINPELEKTNINEFERRTLYLSGLLNKFGTSFSSGDFFSCIETTNKGDIVFLDPPYPSQSEEIYYKISPEYKIREDLVKSIEHLTKSKVDFILLYGARMVSIEYQFDEESLNVDHLIRLSTHPVFGHFLDHIYVPKSLGLNSERLPLGVEFYRDFFRKNKEIDYDEYYQVLTHLQSKKFANI